MKLSKCFDHLNKDSDVIEELGLLKYVIGCLRYFKCQEYFFKAAAFT
jgi:hypothetical protein